VTVLSAALPQLCELAAAAATAGPTAGAPHALAAASSRCMPCTPQALHPPPLFAPAAAPALNPTLLLPSAPPPLPSPAADGGAAVAAASQLVAGMGQLLGRLLAVRLPDPRHMTLVGGLAHCLCGWVK
jgi:hypothetical protein